MSLWFVSICTRYLGYGTEQVRRATQPSWDIRERTPRPSTRCIDAQILSHCTLCPLARSAPLTTLYPMFGIVLLISDTNESSSSSVQLLQREVTDKSHSLIRRQMVVRETPEILLMVSWGKPSFRKWISLSLEKWILGRPHPCDLSISTKVATC